MVEALPRFSFELIKQGIGNPIAFKLSDITDAMRAQLQNYTLAVGKLKYWSFQIDEWFSSDNTLMDYNVYHLCLTFPNSQQFSGHIQNLNLASGFGSNVILVASSGVGKSMDTGTPFIGGNGSGEFVFTKSADATLAANYNSDDIVLTVRDQNGNAVTADNKFKIKLKYKEYVSF
jgi:hypothetical protein